MLRGIARNFFFRGPERPIHLCPNVNMKSQQLRGLQHYRPLQYFKTFSYQICEKKSKVSLVMVVPDSWNDLPGGYASTVYT